MYKSFRVKNFRCFKDLQINDLGRVNLIAGKNNTGKTALLEAMYLHTRPKEPVTLLHLQQVRNIDSPQDDYPAYWKHYFNDFETSNDIEIDGANELFSHKVSITEVLRDHDTEGHFSNVYYYLLDQGLANAEADRLAGQVTAAMVMQCQPEEGTLEFTYLYSNGTHTNPIARSIRSNFIPAQGRPNNKNLNNQYSELVRKGRLRTLVKALSALEPRIEDVRMLKTYGDEMIWGEVLQKYLPLKLMGEGTNRVLHFIVSCMSNQNGYLFIDEIENGVHYSAQKDVWKAIGQVARDSELNIQVFATTHSLEMIRAAYEAFSEDGKLEEFRLHRLDRNPEGDIEAVTYNKSSIESAMSTNWEIRG